MRQNINSAAGTIYCWKDNHMAITFILPMVVSGHVLHLAFALMEDNDDIETLDEKYLFNQKS